MDNLQEESRRQFEEYFEDFYGGHPTDHHDPIHVEGIWQASRANIVVEIEKKDDALRAIAFHVSVGGYNANSVDAEVFQGKIIDGINDMCDVFIKRAEAAEQRAAKLTTQAE